MRQNPVAYTSVLQEVVTRSTGAVEQGFRNVWAVRRDVSLALMATRHVANEKQARRHLTFRSGLNVYVDDVRRVRSTIGSKPNPQVTWLRDPTTNCVKYFGGAGGGEEFLKKEMVAGYRTAVVKFGNGLTMWYALDYGCAVVKSVAGFGKQGMTEQRLLSLSSGEPDASYFRVPATYREVPPSRIMSDCGPSTGKALLEYDEEYRQHRPTAAMMTALETGPGPPMPTGVLVEEEAAPSLSRKKAER